MIGTTVGVKGSAKRQCSRGEAVHRTADCRLRANRRQIGNYPSGLLPFLRPLNGGPTVAKIANSPALAGQRIYEIRSSVPFTKAGNKCGVMAQRYDALPPIPFHQ